MAGGSHAKNRRVGGEERARRPSHTASSIAMFAAPSVGSVTSKRQVSVTAIASHGTVMDARRSRARRSVDDGLVDELTEQLAKLTLPRSGLRLGHQDGHQLLSRIHPEHRAARAAPVVFAGRAGNAAETVRAADREAQTEAVARREQPGLDVAEVIRGHQTDGRPR